MKTFTGLCEFEGVERVHLMGIGGAGMSALAVLLSGMGFEVSGCDVARNDTVGKLERSGAACALGHSPDHIEKFLPQLLIYSSAVDENHEELAAARAVGIQTIGRGLALSRLFNAARGVGVAGTHGKTTTSSMIGLVLERGGFSPTLAIGAEVCDLGGGARLGGSGLFVAEIDESDGSFEFFKPALTAVTNVDWDHVNYFRTHGDVLAAFGRFAAARKSGTPLVICAEDEGSQSLIAALRPDPNIVACGWGRSYDWGAFDVTRKAGGGVSFSVACGKDILGRMELAVSGDHNIMNALVACASCSILGVPFESIAGTMRDFRGAKRRLEKIGEKKIQGGSVEVIDDYGHHPTEIAASLAAARDIYPEPRRLAVVFQPHRHTRTRAFYRQIAAALGGGDLVFLLPVYSAGELPKGPGEITSADILDIIKKDGRDAALCGGHEDALAKLDSALRPGDVLLTVGAGNVTKLGEAYLKS